MSGWVNYDSVIGQLQQAGLILDKEINPNNTWQSWRVEGEDRERRGRSIIKEWVGSKGDAFLVGIFGVWHGNHFDQVKLEIPKQTGERDVTDDERKAMAAANKQLLKEAEEGEKLEAKRAADIASHIWRQCPPSTEHPYLTKKQIKSHGARVLGEVDTYGVKGLTENNAAQLKRSRGALVVPMHDTAGSVKGLQLITDTGKTFWPSGMAMASTFGLIGHFPRGGVLLLTEGFATAASLAEATGLPAAYAFSANNLVKAAKEIRKAAPRLKILIAADDDYLTADNPGCKEAAKASAEVADCDWIKPDFRDDLEQDIRNGKKLTDFNDLRVLTGLPLTLAAQINAKLDAKGWRDGVARAAAGAIPEGGGDGVAIPMKSQLTVDEAVQRYWGTYGLGGKVLFDEHERRLVHKDDVMNLIPPRQWDNLKGHPAWRVARDIEIGFDPTELDEAIRCNLFGGWPSVPKPGNCTALLGLLEYLCSNEPNGDEVYQWILKWLAYPIQHRGAKMHTALVIHGPQGTGKSRFFEAYGKIFGPYFRVLGQEALEDKFNADWAEKKLFILADEVLARQDMYHIKNRLKGFITGDTIRVNPKNVAAHTERNHMNIVFLSNERMPLVMEADDRRHLVVWVPPKLSTQYFDEVNEEIANGGIEALHDYLLNLDLGDFKPWSHPPITRAKEDLQELGKSSEERFINEWLQLELEGPDGHIIPLCPCLGSHLYRVYEQWCERHGERKRGAKDLISCAGKRHGWSSGESRATWTDANDRTVKKRKMIVPSSGDLAEALKRVPGSHRYRKTVLPQPDSVTLAEWLTDGYLAFAMAAGIEL